MHTVMPVARCGLQHLRDQGLGVTKQKVTHGVAAVKRTLQLMGRKAVSGARALHHRCADGHGAAHE